MSLGINLLPTTSKFCNFDCVYCECGWTDNSSNTKENLSDPSTHIEKLVAKINLLQKQNQHIDTITFAGNGEPTLHPRFEKIILETLLVRNLFMPDAKVAVLSNATMLHKKSVVSALQKVDICMFKLDAGSEGVFQKVNQPLGGLTLHQTVERIKQFPFPPTIQSMFFRGTINGQLVDNTLPEELNTWIQLLIDICPKNVILYSIDRPTPQSNLEKIEHHELAKIAKNLEDIGINTSIA